ncbi:MAG: MFS transporter [Bacteroidota bacterium]
MRIHRIAVTAFFFMSGFTHANWASRLPQLETFLSISHAELGTLLFVMAIGALLAMPFTGWLAYRFGSDKVCLFTAILLCVSTSLIALQTNIYVEGMILFLIGFANGSMDVAMNEQAVLVEREYKKPIMSSFHAFWSIGMASGAGSGALFSRFDVPLSTHLLIVSVIALLGFVYFSTRLIKNANEGASKPASSFLLPSKAIIPLGLIAFCGMLSEGSMLDWSAIYVNEVVGSSKTMGAVAFGVFGAAMTTGRLIGDYLTARLGKKRLLVLDSILAISGLTIILIFPVMPLTTIGLFLAGLGLSTIVPIVYTTAGNMPGISPSVGIAMATTIGYSGFFVGPPTIGFVGENYGLRTGLFFTLLLLFIMFALIAKERFSYSEKAG